MDMLVLGPGLRRGRRDPIDLKVANPLDCWRIERIDAPRILQAEMRRRVQHGSNFRLRQLMTALRLPKRQCSTLLVCSAFSNVIPFGPYTSLFSQECCDAWPKLHGPAPIFQKIQKKIRRRRIKTIPYKYRRLTGSSISSATVDKFLPHNVKQ